MKKRKTIFMIAAITIAAAIIIGLYVMGFRITYNPDLITDWDAVSGCAAWAGVIASVVAIWYAIQVPKKIADRQDKIALFEKRLACYSEIQDVVQFADMIKDSTSVNDLFLSFCSVFGCLNVESAQEAINQLVQIFNARQPVVVSGKFIFSKYNTDQATDLYLAAGDLLMSLTETLKNPDYIHFSEEIKKKRDGFCKKCEEFDKEYSTIMESELNLQ